MNDIKPRRLVGFAGLAAAVLTLIELSLYFVYDGPPPATNVLTRSLLAIVGLTCLTVFMVGLRPLLAGRDSRQDGRQNSDLAPLIASVAGVLWIVIEFVSNGLETGAVIAAHGGPIDRTIAVSGTYILYGSSTRLVEALFLIAFGIAMARSGTLRRWTSWSAFLLAGINLILVPSLYFGNDPANFYAANGWGTTATMGGPFMLWLLSISVATLRGNRTRNAAAADRPTRTVAPVG